MITLAILFIIIVGCAVLLIVFHGKNKKTKDDAYTPVLAILTCIIMITVVGFFLQLIFGIGNYCDSLELEKLRAQALTARQAVLKTHNYSNKSFSAHGDILKGELKINYNVPLIRHKLEAKAVKLISHYNYELARMKGAKRGWLWTPGWGYSDVINSMKPIDVPEMR
jgi:hypothetical protein